MTNIISMLLYTIIFIGFLIFTFLAAWAKWEWYKETIRRIEELRGKKKVDPLMKE